MSRKKKKVAGASSSKDQQEAGWGAKVIDRLTEDLQAEFPDMGGPTARNLLLMKIFARELLDDPIAKQPVSQLPWGQIIRLMQLVKAPNLFDFLGTTGTQKLEALKTHKKGLIQQLFPSPEEAGA
jgi:hypothetical protein